MPSAGCLVQGEVVKVSGDRIAETLPEGTGEAGRVFFEGREVTRRVALQPSLATAQNCSPQPPVHADDGGDGDDGNTMDQAVLPVGYGATHLLHQPSQGDTAMLPFYR